VRGSQSCVGGGCDRRCGETLSYRRRLARSRRAVPQDWFYHRLGTILGAAIVDICMILVEAVRKLTDRNAPPAPPQEDWKRVNVFRLVSWVVFWGIAVAVVGHVVLGEPLRYLLVCIGLAFLFVLVNGISQGISDSNPISSAFVMTVFILAAIGLTDAGTGLMCASILLIACSEGGDMQQDRSTGWRLGTNRSSSFVIR